MARFFDLTVARPAIPQQSGGFISGLANSLTETLAERRAAEAYGGLLDSAYGAEPRQPSFINGLFDGTRYEAQPNPGSMRVSPPLGPSPEAQAGRRSLASLGGEQPAPVAMGPSTGRTLGNLGEPAPQPRISRQALESLLANPATRRLGETLLPGGEADTRRQQQEREWEFKEKDFAADEAYRNQSLALQRQAGARAQRQQDPRALIADRRLLASEAGLQPGTPAYARFMVTGDMGVTDSAPRTTTMYDDNGQPQTAQWDAGSNSWQPLGSAKKPAPRPVPVAIQNAEQSDLDDIQSLGQINDTLGGFIGQLDEGKLQLGPVSNVLAGARNWAGNSSPESRNYASFQAGLEKLRNDTLRLNKGVQTEGDAVRAFNELVANINDPGVVRQRLQEIRQLNQRAAQFKQNQIQHRRQTNNLDALDIGGVTTSGTQPGASSSGAPGQFREGQTARNPETGEQIIFRNGAWGPAR